MFQVLLLLLQVTLSLAAGLRASEDSAYGWYLIILVLLIVGFLSLIIIEAIIIHRLLRLGGVAWRSVWLGQLLLFSILLSYLTLIPLILTPTPHVCRLVRFSVSFSYSLIQAILLVKILIVLSPKTHPGFLKVPHQMLILFLVSAVQVAINSQWLVTLPAHGIAAVERRFVNDDEVSVVCAATFLPEFSLFHEMLVSFSYLLLVGLAIVALTLRAYLYKRKPNDEPHSEAKWVLMTSCTTTAIWLLWVIVGLTLKDNNIKMAVLAIGLWTTATTTLFIMFVPKLHKLATLKDGGK